MFTRQCAVTSNYPFTPVIAIIELFLLPISYPSSLLVSLLSQCNYFYIHIHFSLKQGIRQECSLCHYYLTLFEWPANVINREKGKGDIKIRESNVKWSLSAYNITGKPKITEF